MALLSKYKWLFILVNVSIPLWTLLFARQFSFPMKGLIAIISAVFLNLVLYYALRHKERQLGESL